MTKKNAECSELSERESRVLNHLRQHPEMMARIETILEVARSTEGPLKTADEVEELLVQEIRLLGHATMKEWASGAEARVSEEIKGRDATIRSRKKKR